MDLDDKITRAKELIAKREEIDAELSQLLTGTIRTRAPATCSNCGETGHRSTQCQKPKNENRGEP